MKKISTIFMTAICMIAAVSMTSCKDYDDDRYFDQNTSIPIESSLSDYLTNMKGTLEGQITSLQTQLNNLTASCDCQDKWNTYFVTINQINTEINDLKNQITTLAASIPDVSGKADQSEVDALNKKIDDLLTKIENLQTQLNNQKTCECDWAGLQATLAIIKQSLQDQLDKKADKSALEQLVSEVQTMNYNLTQEIVNLGDRIAALETARTTIENAISKLQGDVTTINSTLNALNSKVADINTAITALTTVVKAKADITYVNEQLEIVKDNLQSQINSINSKIRSLQSQINYLSSLIGGSYDDTALRNLIAALQTAVDALEGRVSKLEGTVSTLNTTVAGLQTSVSNLQTDMYHVQDSLYTVTATANANAEWIDAMKGLYGENLDSLNPCTCALADSVAMLRAEADSLVHVSDSLMKIYVNEAVNGLEVTLNTKLADLEKAYQDADKVLQSQIDELRGDVNDLTTRVNEIEGQIAEIRGVLSTVVNRLNSQISSIIVQSVTTPLFLDANVALPVGLQTNVICAYYGEVENSLTWFPSSSKTANLSDKDEILSDDEVQSVEGFDYNGLPQGTSLTSTGGKVYLTINPSNVNFTGAGLKLVDSQNGDAGFKLENVKKSDKVLSFASRAADNGFYEADATLTDAGKAAFPTAPLKDAAKDLYSLLKNHTGVRDLATSVVKAAYKSVSLPAYAVQAPYTYTDENGNEVTAYVHSNYNIAATAVHPLSYNLADKIDDATAKLPRKFLRQIPYLKSIDAWKSIQTKLYFEFDDVEYLTWTDVTVAEIKFVEDSTYIKVTVEYQQPTKVDPATSEVSDWESKSLEVKITGEEMGSMAAVINDAIQKDMVANLNSKFKDVQVDFIDAVNEALKNTSETINSTLKDVIDEIDVLLGRGDSYIKRMNNLIDRINDQLQNAYDRLDNAGHYLMPVMFFSNSEGTLKQLSSYESMAGYVNAGYMTLYPTSYTAEILNPAAKKVVQVTKAKKLSTGVNDTAEVAAANQSLKKDGKCYLNKVLDGNVRAVGVQLKSGYAYEFAYSALDYTGYQITQRYWIRVK